MYLPTDHAGADELIRSADLAMVYGGQDVVDNYAADPTVMVNGPGRAKILITADQDWRDYLDLIVDSIANLGGMACVNTTAVLYEGDPAPLAHAIAERSVDDRRRCRHRRRAPFCPASRRQRARRWPTIWRPRPRAPTPLLGADQVVAALGDGYAALRPAVHLLADPTSAQAQRRTAVPLCLGIAVVARRRPGPLRHSLVITAITTDDELIDDLLAEPTVTNVYRGQVPTHYAAPHIPHDGFLADFLMRNKGFVQWGNSLE